MDTQLIIILSVAGIIVLWAIATYNGLIRKKNNVENAFGGMDVQLKKRYDLIPNLISTVKQYMTHEKELLTKVTELRSKAVSGNLSDEEKVDLDNQITGTLKGIMVAVEGYPDLKASNNFMNLQKTLNEVESQISAARRAYNAAVIEFNNAVQMFPSKIIAGMMHLKAKKVFEIPETERQNINAGDLFNS
ncbi:MAG: LemA family protein [Chlorobi bacterium]|nr:LemA family protein [Chlorobiota bacterium]